MSELRNGSKFTSVRFRKLSSNGHDEWSREGEEIQKEFSQLIANGYALFVRSVEGDTQVRSLLEAEAYWNELEGDFVPMVTAVPALRGGTN